ncbi:MAG: MBL fold metallo-hydrolase [Sellimonas intestinalis]
MKVTYLYHSGFAIEDEQALYVFDYYKGELPVIAKEKQMYVFVSHRHKDHYNSEIFDWEKEHPNILYILSDDVEAEPAPNRIFVKPEQKIRTGELKVETLRSTDEGVAFLVTCKDKLDLPCRRSELVALGGREHRLQRDRCGKIIKERSESL